MYNSRPATLAVLIISLLAGAGAVVTHAREGDDAKPANDIAMVDLERIYDESDAPQQFAQAAAQLENDAQSRADTVAGLPQLTDAELREFGDLIGRKNPDQQQKVRMEELKSFNDKRAEHLREVQTKPEKELTPEDRKLMTDAAAQRRQFDRMITAMESDLRQQVVEREHLVKKDLVAGLRVEIAKVAREKKVKYVFDTTALVSSSVDLTQAVIARVKKK